MKYPNLNLFAITCFVLLSYYFSFAQGFENKNIQAGITTSLGLNFIKMGTSKIDNDGVGTNYTIGLLLHKSFKDSKNIGFSFGLEFDFNSIKFQVPSLKDSIFYNYSDREILPTSDESENIFLLSNRKHKIIQISLPIAFLFRTDAIGDFRYFLKFGLKNSFLLSNKMTDEGKDITTDNLQILKENLHMTSKNEMFFYQASLGLSLGAEWNFIGSTALVAEMSYYYGLTPLFLDLKPQKKTLYEYNTDNFTSEIKPFSNKATQNQFNLKLALLF